jgi:hypothetical protein
MTKEDIKKLFGELATHFKNNADVYAGAGVGAAGGALIGSTLADKSLPETIVGGLAGAGVGGGLIGAMKAATPGGATPPVPEDLIDALGGAITKAKKGIYEVLVSSPVVSGSIVTAGAAGGLAMATGVHRPRDILFNPSLRKAAKNSVLDWKQRGEIKKADPGYFRNVLETIRAEAPADKTTGLGRLSSLFGVDPRKVITTWIPSSFERSRDILTGGRTLQTAKVKQVLDDWGKVYPGLDKRVRLESVLKDNKLTPTGIAFHEEFINPRKVGNIATEDAAVAALKRARKSATTYRPNTDIPFIKTIPKSIPRIGGKRISVGKGNAVGGALNILMALLEPALMYGAVEGAGNIAGKVDAYRTDPNK